MKNWEVVSFRLENGDFLAEFGGGVVGRRRQAGHSGLADILKIRGRNPEYPMLVNIVVCKSLILDEKGINKK